MVLFIKTYILIITFFLANICHSQSNEVLRPRGVPLQKKVFYDPSKEFSCLDGSLTIPFVFVNDDYCDCQDGSDEPGTPACSNGVYHCSNIGHLAANIPSSRVNDGICDCCDGSDEYNSSVQCVNNCHELGKEALEEARRLNEILETGSQIRSDYIKDATEKKTKDRLTIEELKSELVQIEAEKNEKEELKKNAEQLERTALDKHNAEKDAARKEQEEAQEKFELGKDKDLAHEAFGMMDENSDGILTYQEVQKLDLFDKNHDGTVDEDEAKFFLHMKNEMAFDEFLTTGWIIMKPHYLQAKENSLRSTTEASTGDSHVDAESYPTDDVTESPDVEDSDLDDAENGHEHEDHQIPPGEETNDEEDDGAPYSPPAEQSSDSVEPNYDDETKELVDRANAARQAFSEIENRYVDVKGKIREIEVSLETDYGYEGEFLPLHGKCFEWSDFEYTYKFCPFDRASQQPKGGGLETNLGRWGSWSGVGDKYNRMKMDGGAQCWNGPTRSVNVDLKCGVENQLLGASEPSRCEYRFQFETPALCRLAPPGGEHGSSSKYEHTEL